MTLLGVVVVALALLLAPRPASAHATLLETEPADRAALDAAPEAVRLVFDEVVDVAPDGVRVFDADAQRVDEALEDTPDRSIVAAALPQDLPDGGYVVTWRVVSDDGHPVQGAFAFTVGDAEAVDDALVAELFGGGADRLLGTLGSLLRGLGYLGTLFAAGAAVFALAIATSGADRDRARRLAVLAAAGGALVTVAAVPVQTMAVTGGGLFESLAPGGGLGATLSGSFGQGTLLRLAALAGLVVAWRRRPATAWLLAPAGLALASYLLDGHQRTADPAWLVVGADAVHLGAGAVWFAGLVLVALGLRARSIDDDPLDGATLVVGFSRVAGWAVLAILAAGTAMAWALVRVPRGLFATTYGRLLVAKLVVVGALLLIAVLNRRRLVPAVAARLTPAGSSDDATPDSREQVERRARAAWAHLRRTVRLEAVGVALVLMLTGFLVVQQPAADELGVTGAYQTTVEFTDELDLDVVVDPNRVGRNAIHLYVLDPTGRPADDVEDLRIELTYLAEDIGPFVVEPFAAGPGHWVANVDQLRFAGEWRLRVVAAVDRFEEASREVAVMVNP